MSFSPDGKQVASGGYDKSVKLWNLEEGTCESRLSWHQVQVRCVAFSPDDLSIASCGSAEYDRIENQDNSVRLWDVKTGTSCCS